MLVHPGNSNIVLACSYADGVYNNTYGLYRSTDAGVTFTKVFPANVATYAKGVIWDVESAEISGGKQCFYFVEGNNINTGALSSECGIYKSFDDGATWVKISNGGLPTGTTIGKAAQLFPKAIKQKFIA